jgi:hypothetical protein
MQFGLGLIRIAKLFLELMENFRWHPLYIVTIAKEFILEVLDGRRWVTNATAFVVETLLKKPKCQQLVKNASLPRGH